MAKVKRINTEIDAACKRNNHGKLDPSSLPGWFTCECSYITCNKTMPSLRYFTQNLKMYLDDETLTVCRYGGVYCPVHLLNGKKHVHSGNGVYVGVKVMIC